jgi:hypothetical protein
MILLVVAVIYEFGIKRGVGADHLSFFFDRIHLSKHFGASPSSILTLMGVIEKHIVAYGRACEKDYSLTNEGIGITAAGDETFFSGFLILVLMDLTSGYMMMEEIAQDRSYDTWEKRAQECLGKLGIHVDHFVSDCAKSLVKLALSAFNCSFGADLFHGSHELVKWLGLAFHRRMTQVSVKLEEARKAVAEIHYAKAVPAGLRPIRSRSIDTSASEVRKREQEVERLEGELKQVQSGRDSYLDVLGRISEAVHPFSLDGKRQTSEQVVEVLHQQARKVKEAAENSGISDNRDHLGKFERQINAMTGGIDAWWLLVDKGLESQNVSQDMRNWLIDAVLPVVYWHKQITRTENIKLKGVYQTAWKQAHDVFESHPTSNLFSSDQVNQWHVWADWVVGKFHRASSAVEGRNGWLSQMYRNGRGLNSLRLQVLTISHNYDIRRNDGTTAAERLFGKKHPDLFEWLMDKMEELPQARRKRKHVVHNPLIIQTVPA